MCNIKLHNTSFTQNENKLLPTCRNMVSARLLPTVEEVFRTKVQEVTGQNNAYTACARSIYCMCLYVDSWSLTDTVFQFYVKCTYTVYTQYIRIICIVYTEWTRDKILHANFETWGYVQCSEIQMPLWGLCIILQTLVRGPAMENYSARSHQGAVPRVEWWTCSGSFSKNGRWIGMPCAYRYIGAVFARSTEACSGWRSERDDCHAFRRSMGGRWDVRKMQTEVQPRKGRQTASQSSTSPRTDNFCVVTEVLGIYDRPRNQLIAMRIPDRKGVTLRPLFYHSTVHGSRGVTDDWGGYNFLTNEGWRHLAVVHKK